LITLSGCGAEDDPYAALTDAELSYVVPGSAEWAEGDPCEGADCGGPVTSAELPNASWFVLNGVRVIEDGIDEERSIAILIDVEEGLRGHIDQETIEARAWAQDVEWILEVLAAGHDVWAAMNCDGLEPEVICHFVAIDDQGRFAGIGYGAGRYFTTPLAREAHAQRAASGQQFLRDIITG
jgi:hypothetical protein